MARRRKDGPLESNMAPAPEGPDEVYRKYERLNRRGLPGNSGGLRKPTEGAGKKTLYGALAVVEVAAIVLGFFFDVPFMDIVAFGLPGLLVMFYSSSKDESTDEPGDESRSETGYEPGEESLLDRLLSLLGDQGAQDSTDQRHTENENY